MTFSLAAKARLVAVVLMAALVGGFAADVIVGVIDQPRAAAAAEQVETVADAADVDGDRDEVAEADEAGMFSAVVRWLQQVNKTNGKVRCKQLRTC